MFLKMPSRAKAKFRTKAPGRLTVETFKRNGPWSMDSKPIDRQLFAEVRQG